MIIRYVALVSLSAMSFSVWASFKNDSSYSVTIGTHFTYQNVNSNGVSFDRSKRTGGAVVKPGETFQVSAGSNQATIYVNGKQIKRYAITDHNASYSITDALVEPKCEEKKKEES